MTEEADIGTTIGEIVTTTETGIRMMAGETVPETDTGTTKTGAAGNGVLHRMTTAISGGGWRALLHEGKYQVINVRLRHAFLLLAFGVIQISWDIISIILCVLWHIPQGHGALHLCFSVEIYTLSHNMNVTYITRV